MAEPREPVKRWYVRATYPTASVGEPEARERQLGRAAGRMPDHSGEVGWVASAERTASAEWEFETRADALELEKRIRGQIGDAIPGLSVFAKGHESRVLRTEEFQITADDLRNGKAICVSCGAGLRKRVVPTSVTVGTKIPVKCGECDMLNEWHIIAKPSGPLRADG